VRGRRGARQPAVRADAQQDGGGVRGRRAGRAVLGGCGRAARGTGAPGG
jgi:hypothetical protein